MKGHTINSLHHCKSIKNPCTGIFVPPRIMTDCNDACFHKDFYQPKQYQNPSYICHPVYPSQCYTFSSPIYSTCYPMPLIIAQQCLFHRSTYSQRRKIKQKLLDPSSNRITVRRITPSHVAVKKYSNKDSDKFHFDQPDQILSTSHQQFETTQITNIYEKDHLNSNNQKIPSVPSMKIVLKNDGIQVSSTSFITTTDDRKSFISDDISENSTEHFVMSLRSSKELSFSTTQVDRSNNLSVHNSKSPNSNEMTTSANKLVIITSDVDKSINIPTKNLITKQIESIPDNAIEEHSFITTDKGEEHKWHSMEEVLSLLAHESNINTTATPTNDSTIEQPSIDISQPPNLQSSISPNINTIKSNEMLPYSSRSITSLINEKQKTSTAIKNPSLPLRNARSTLDFGLLIDEITKQNF